MQEALAKIKKELGPDAIIISSKLVRSKSGIFGLFSPKVYEVIAEADSRKVDVRKPSMAITDTFASKKAAEKDDLLSTDFFSELVKSAPKAGDTITPVKPVVTNKAAVPTITPPPAPRPSAMNDSFSSIKSEKIDLALKQAQLMEQNQRGQKTIQDLDNKIDQLSDIIQNFSTKLEPMKREFASNYTPAVENILVNLMENDVEEEYAHDICKRVQELMEKKEVSHLEALDYVLRDTIGEIKEIEPNKFERKVVMVIGPTGVGKTTTLVKLASYFVVKQELKVGIINTDVYRVAAQEQLKTFAKILNVPMAIVYKPSEIKDALKQFENMDIVFIDTAGKVSTDTEYQEDIKGFVEEGQVDDIYLALSGSSSTRILKETINNYAFLKKHNIIITKMDEGIRKGVLINVKMMSGRPLSYITIGQSVPDDIQKVDVSAVISDMMRY